ncbi:MAG: serine/threonine protein kinase [Treponema sp.]|nr:serine/threonine protein kinase [Treponema sp.]
MSEKMNEDFPPMIGKYKIIGVIARGGMGVVYKAVHPSLKRYVVIKKMTSRGNNGNATRFKNEAKILLDMQSPYIVHLHDYFTEGSYRYMVEELVDGAALDKLIHKQTCLPVPIAMLFMQDACYALKYAHSKKIVHRDIKPGNILISKRGEIKLADFGIARDEESDENLTQSDATLGTPAYMPPEQFEKSADVDQRADIYALGIMLYEMITGTKPYPGSFTKDTLKTVKKGKYIKPRKLDKNIPLKIQRLIHKMIRPKAKNRYQSINKVLRVVKNYLKHYDTHELRVQIAKSVITPQTYSFPVVTPKDKLRRRISAAALSLLAVVLIVTGAFKLGFFHRTVLSKIYTPVNVEIKLPKSVTQNLDLPIRAFFFEDDGKDLPEVKNSNRTFAIKGTRKFDWIFKANKDNKEESASSKYVSYDTTDVFLKKGKYRVKVVAGPYVWWNSFNVADKAVTVNCDALKNIKNKLEVTTFVSDRVSGEDLSKKAKVFILHNGGWVELSKYPEDKIVSGTVWKFKIDCEGYESENYSLLIDWYQERLFISAELTPLKKDE